MAVGVGVSAGPALPTLSSVPAAIEALVEEMVDFLQWTWVTAVLLIVIAVTVWWYWDTTDLGKVVDWLDEREDDDERS